MRNSKFFLILATMAICHITMARSCPAEAKEAPAHDAHSFARPEKVRVTHVDLDLDVDFERRVLKGRVGVQIVRKEPGARLVLDTNGLTIHGVYLADGATRAPFELGENQDHLGAPLSIKLPDTCNMVFVDYETSPKAKALQWLKPAQTAGKNKPFLFSQSQAILARSWIPCQDSPGVRSTYQARVKVPRGLLALMSAENPTALTEDGVYTFKMEQPIPAYLLALAVGELEFRAIGKRSGIYAEPSVAEAAAWEFAQTERMMGAAEKLYGPYRWDRYDILVLPPSFPFGGMENPRLTFATPTVLAGDRSLVALIAHELAHSWSGNLVTNATWNDFWLNEGFTVYFEHRIMEEVNGRRFDEMTAQLGKADLLKDMGDLSPRDTWLHLDLAGRDPDDGMTNVAYEKGYLFLRMLEEAVGRQKWDPFLRSYFDKHAFQSMTTAKFLDYLDAELLSDLPAADRRDLKIDAWVYGPGLPDNNPSIEADELKQIEAQGQTFTATGDAKQLSTEAWTTHHWLCFLRGQKRPMPIEHMRALDERFQLSQSGNSEIMHDWLLHAITANYEPAMPALEKFLTEQGRRKFLTPLYRELMGTEAGKQRAAEIYEQARPLYHPVSAETIDDVLGWSLDRN